MVFFGDKQWQNVCLQTSINVEGFRSLREGEPVEYDLDVSEDGRAKAINVTGPKGQPPLVCIPQKLTDLLLSLSSRPILYNIMVSGPNRQGPGQNVCIQSLHSQ